MSEFIHNHFGAIIFVLFLLMLPFYIKKVQGYAKASQKKTKARKQRLKR